MISLSRARFCDFSYRGYGNGFFLDWLAKLYDNSFQTPYSVTVEDFFEVRFQLIILWHDYGTDIWYIFKILSKTVARWTGKIRG